MTSWRCITWCYVTLWCYDVIKISNSYCSTGQFLKTGRAKYIGVLQTPISRCTQGKLQFEKNNVDNFASNVCKRLFPWTKLEKARTLVCCLSAGTKCSRNFSIPFCLFYFVFVSLFASITAIVVSIIPHCQRLWYCFVRCVCGGGIMGLILKLSLLTKYPIVTFLSACE